MDRNCQHKTKILLQVDTAKWKTVASITELIGKSRVVLAEELLEKALDSIIRQYQLEPLYEQLCNLIQKTKEVEHGKTQEEKNKD